MVSAAPEHNDVVAQALLGLMNLANMRGQARADITILNPHAAAAAPRSPVSANQSSPAANPAGALMNILRLCAAGGGAGQLQPQALANTFRSLADRTPAGTAPASGSTNAELTEEAGEDVEEETKKKKKSKLKQHAKQKATGSVGTSSFVTFTPSVTFGFEEELNSWTISNESACNKMEIAKIHKLSIAACQRKVSMNADGVTDPQAPRLQLQCENYGIVFALVAELMHIWWFFFRNLGGSIDATLTGVTGLLSSISENSSLRAIWLNG